MGERHGVGKDTVARIWQGRKLRPWRVETFKLSNDPDFEAKLVDVVGLYLNPPERAEPVKRFETTSSQLFCMSASRDGSLIQAAVGSLGGVGRRPWNRSGCAANAASSTMLRCSRIAVAVP